MATAAQAHQLSDYYIKKYVERYGEKPIINRNKARWSWDNIMHDLKPAEIRELLDYYFASNSAKAHDLDNFFYNYDKIITSKIAYDKDRVERKRMMKETEERTRRWREKVDKRTQGN